MEGFAAQLKEEKEMALNASMEKLVVGISDAKVQSKVYTKLALQCNMHC